MKTCNEMVNSLLERKEQYEVEKKKKKKKLLCVVAAVCCIALLISAIRYVSWRNYVPTNIEYAPALDTAVNLYDPREVVGVKDYVFVCRVVEIHDYVHEKSHRDFPEVIHYYDMPFTECNIEIIKNIKGDLIEGAVTAFYKVGGINHSKTAIYLDKDDIMTEAGKYYIFTGMAHPDGTMTGGGTNGTIELEEGINKDNLETSAIYQKYVDAYKNQIKPDYNIFDFKYYAKADMYFNNGISNAEIYEKYLRTKIENGSSVSEKYDKALKAENPKLENILEKVLSE